MKAAFRRQPPGIQRRKERALKLLYAQLKKGTKPEKIEGRTTTKQVPLNQRDLKRINVDIGKLNKV